jgi:RNase P subunit RPR2
MLLRIHDNLLIEDIQEHFSECFPHLKIEVYSTPHHWKRGLCKKILLVQKVQLATSGKTHSGGIMEIKSSDKVGDVEQKLKKMFDLNVQIFRKENDCWIQTYEYRCFYIRKRAELSKKSKTTLVNKIKEQSDEYDYL